jgi:CDGSH-type Zn-finger protein
VSEPVHITIRPKGPYLIQGLVEIRDSDGNLIVPPVGKTPNTVKLCGCGRSLTKPFCDGTHKQLESPPTNAGS